MERAERALSDYGNPRHSRRALRRSEGPRADQEPRAARAERRRRLHQRAAPRAVLRRVDRLRRAPRLRAGRRHPARGLAAVRAHGPVLRQAVRSGHQRQLRRCCSTCRSRWASRADGVCKLEYASFLAACLAYLSHRQRDRVGIVTFDDDVVNYVPPSAKHFNVLLQTLDRSRGRAAGPPARDARTSWPSTSSAAASSR